MTSEPSYILNRGDYYRARLAALGAKNPDLYEVVVLNGELMQGLIAENLNPMLERILEDVETRLIARLDAIDQHQLSQDRQLDRLRQRLDSLEAGR